MKKIVGKLVFGDLENRTRSESSVIRKRIRNIKGIWNNESHADVGVEKIFRLFLAASQFLFPGIYIKHFFGKKNVVYQDVAMDFYILSKVAFPFLFLYNGLSIHRWTLYLIIWLLLETILYVPTLIFASDHFGRPSSYRRSMLMLFFNYLEIAFSYAFIYSSGNYLNQPFNHWYDPIYFSMVTLSTIGIGDYYPVTGIGKLLVSSQSIIFLMFVVLFINFFSNKVESRGYFAKEKPD